VTVIKAREFEDARQALQQHQVVAFIGARGTGKAQLARQLEAHLRSVEVVVVSVDAGKTESAADFNAGLGAALKCSDASLALGCLSADERVRVIVENCEELFDRPWFVVVQEQWRALMSSEEARGRVGAILFGRPRFQDVAGGQGSPLLNIGPVLRARPLTEAEIMADYSVAATVARAVHRKTGGHPRLTEALIGAIDGDVKRLETVSRGFAHDHERYLIRLAEDHTVAGMAMLSDVVEADKPLAESAVISAHFGSAYSRGQECLADLAGSGLVERLVDGTCRLGAAIMRESSAARHFLRAPLAEIPISDAGRHTEAAALLYGVENRLRQKVAECLGEVDRAWWPNRVSDKIAAQAESRRQDEMESLVAPLPEPHPIMYLHITEIFDVIMLDSNWTQVFRVRLPLAKQAVRTEAEMINKIRIKVAHNRPISDDDLLRLEIAARRLGVGQ
jgi:hypothetical protein